MNTRIPIICCIDIEPDARMIDPQVPVDWAGFEKCYEFFSRVRRRLVVATAFPVHFSWFLRMDPQVTHTYGSPDWAVTRYRSLLEEFKARGDELGLHAHAWRWNEETEAWIEDFGDQKWVDHCVRSSFETFQTSLNQSCRSFRFGDHWMNNETIKLLETLGARFDLTTEPGALPCMPFGEPSTGSFPDYTRIPQVPYRPSEHDFTKQSWWRKRSLWIIPVSASSTETAVPARAPDRGKWLVSNQPVHQDCVTLNLAVSQSIFSPIFDKLLGSLRNPFIVTVARTDIAVDAEQRANLEQNIEFLLSHPLARRFSFETPAEAMRRLRLRFPA